MRQQGCEGGGRGPLPMAPHGALHIGQDSRKASATMPCHSLITAVRAWEPGEAAGRGKGVLERGGELAQAAKHGGWRLLSLRASSL